MGSNCCRHKDQSPKVSLRRIFSRWTHRISPKSETVKIADAEQGYTCKKKESVADPVFDAPENEERNHVTLLLPDAPRLPTRKKTRLNNKRVSFQSDVEIMRTASSKSLDRFTVTVVQEEPRPRSKSFDSFFDLTGLGPRAEYLKTRRTSSLEHLAVEEVQSVPSLVSKLRRDTLGDALDFNAYKRPLVLPKPEEPLIEESDEPCSDDEEDEMSSFKLAAKLRRDTLGDALLLSKGRTRSDTPTGSSTEDLEETVKHSRLCSKLRRDTFGDALRQAVHCKACSSMEDMTELEVPLPASPKPVHFVPDLADTATEPDGIQLEPPPADEEAKSHRPPYLRVESSCAQCKTCRSLEVDSKETDQCALCSSDENIPGTNNRVGESPPSNHKPTSPSDYKESPHSDCKPTPQSDHNPIPQSNHNPTPQSDQNPTPLPDHKPTYDSDLKPTPTPRVQPLENKTVRKLTFTDAEISQTLEKIRTTGKIEPKEPYNLVYSSCMKGPFACSKESLNKPDSKSSSTDSLGVDVPKRTDTLKDSDRSRNHLIT